MRRVAVLGVSVALALVAAPSPGADAAETTLKIALVLPSSEADVAAGAALAADASNDVKAAGAKRPAVEIVTFSAGDASIAALAIEKAAKEKFAGVVAAVPENVAADMEMVARRAKLPLVHVGPGGPMRTLDPADPVFRVEPSAADRALQIAEWLRFRSGKSSIGLPAKTEHAWLVVEDAPWAHALTAALRADDVDGIVAAGEIGVGRTSPGVNVTVNPPPDCDRVVVVGGPTASAFIRASAATLPMLCLDTALADADAAKRPKTAFLAATPKWADEKQLDQVVAKHPLKSGQLTPATVRGFVATSAVIEAALNAGKRGVVAALRDVHAGAGGTEAPLFDPTGCVDRWNWAMWAATAESPAAPIKPAYLPDAGEGLFLGGHPGARYRVTPGSTCVHVGYGGGDVPRTVDADLATIGLSGADTKANEMVLDQIVARTCSKLSRVWCRSYDGSARPAYSFKINFVPEGTATTGASAVWQAVIAGDGPDGLHGGQSFPKLLRAQALSTFLIRNAALLQKAKLTPPLAATDVQYLDGSYAWNTSADDNTRSDKIRALIDGVASTYCMKLSKEIGHLAGLDVDHSGDPRSIMVAKGGEGTSDEFAYFPPAFAKVLEKTLGRVGAEGK